MFKFYFVELIENLKIASFFIGALMLGLFLFNLLGEIDKGKLKDKSFIRFIYNEVSCRKTYMIFMIIFLFVIQIFIPSQFVLEKMFNI